MSLAQLHGAVPFSQVPSGNPGSNLLAFQHCLSQHKTQQCMTPFPGELAAASLKGTSAQDSPVLEMPRPRQASWSKALPEGLHTCHLAWTQLAVSQLSPLLMPLRRQMGTSGRTLHWPHVRGKLPGAWWQQLEAATHLRGHQHVGRCWQLCRHGQVGFKLLRGQILLQLLDFGVDPVS